MRAGGREQQGSRAHLEHNLRADHGLGAIEALLPRARKVGDKSLRSLRTDHLDKVGVAEVARVEREKVGGKDVVPIEDDVDPLVGARRRPCGREERPGP